jgi:hypothetical protein
MKRLLTAACLCLLLLIGLSLTAAAQTRATVTVRLVDTLSTGSSQPGDTFTATLASPLVMNERVVAEKDARVIGQVREVSSSGRLKRPALITLSLRTIQAAGGRFPLQTGDLTVRANSHATRNLLIIGGSAGAGAAIGGAAGGGKGAAIGALAGAGAGTVGAYLTGEREIVLPSETLLTFHVTSVTISPKELSRLQRVAPGTGAVHQTSDTTPVFVRRRHHGDDDDDDNDDEHEDRHGHGNVHGDDYEHDGERRDERPQNITVVFHSSHHAGVVIHWPHRVERLILEGDNLDDILEPLCQHTRLSAELLRPRVKIRREDD